MSVRETVFSRHAAWGVLAVMFIAAPSPARAQAQTQTQAPA